MNQVKREAMLCIGMAIGALLIHVPLYAPRIIASHGSIKTKETVEAQQDLFAAIKDKDLARVVSALDAGAAVNGVFGVTCNADTDTPLHLAVNVGSVDIVDVLLQRGADSEALDCFESTALGHLFAKTEQDCAILSFLMWTQSSPDPYVFLNSQSLWLYRKEAPQSFGYQVIKDVIEGHFALEDYTLLRYALPTFFSDMGTYDMIDPVGVVLTYAAPHSDNKVIDTLLCREVQTLICSGKHFLIASQSTEDNKRKRAAYYKRIALIEKRVGRQGLAFK